MRHLTEKRITELTRSISETKEEFLALKKEVEQIERGEMDDKILQIWQDIQTEIISKEEAEGRNGREVIPVKLKSPTSSSLLKYQEQLKLRKQISSPSTSPIQDAAPKATEVDRPLKAEEKVIGQLEDPMEKMDITQTPLGATGGAKIIIKKEVPSLERHGDTSTEEESPLPKALTTPKEERFGGLPLHIACTESPIPQFTSDMHIILQQPNTALMRVARVLPTSLVQTALGLVSPVGTLNTKPTTKPTVVSEKAPLQIQPQDIPEPIVHPSSIPEALPKEDKVVPPSLPLPSSETVAPTTKTPEITPLSETTPHVPPVSLSPPHTHTVTATVLASTLQTPTPLPEASPTVEPKSLPASSQLTEEPTPLEPGVPMEDDVREEEGKEKETEMDTSQPREVITVARALPVGVLSSFVF